jgi:aminopeptidase N
MVEEAMSAFNHEIHAKHLQAYEPKFFEVLPEIFKSKDSEYAKGFYHNLYPRDDNVEYYIE